MGVGVEELGHWKRQIPRLFEIHGLHDKGQTRAIGCGGFWPLNCDRKQNPVEDLIIVWDMLRNITLTYELDPAEFARTWVDQFVGNPITRRTDSNLLPRAQCQYQVFY